MVNETIVWIFKRKSRNYLFNNIFNLSLYQPTQFHVYEIVECGIKFHIQWVFELHTFDGLNGYKLEADEKMCVFEISSVWTCCM